MKHHKLFALAILPAALSAVAQTPVPPLTDAGASSPPAAASTRGAAPLHRAAAPTRRASRAAAQSLKGNAEAAVDKGANWQMKKMAVALGEDGRVIYTYGAGMPVVVCALLQLCVVELQPGERVKGDIQLGDSVRWKVTPAEFGTGKNLTTQVVIKPTEDGLKTTLLVSTDRRSYYLQLESHPTQHVTRVAFSYPDDDKAAWAAYATKQAALASNEGPSLTQQDGGPTATSVEKLSFNYTIEGDTKFKPIRVMDNGSKVYIQLPAGSKSEEIPVLVVLGADGKEQIVNSRFKNGWFEVDRLFERAALIMGIDKNQQKVVITSTDRYKARGFWFSSAEN